MTPEQIRDARAQQVGAAARRLLDRGGEGAVTLALQVATTMLDEARATIAERDAALANEREWWKAAEADCGRLRDALTEARAHLRGLLWDRLDYTDREADEAVAYIDAALNPTDTPAWPDPGTQVEP